MKRSRSKKRSKSYVAVVPHKEELKFFDSTLGAVSFTAAGNIYAASVNLIPQGDGAQERDGRGVTVKSIEIRGAMALPSTPTASDTADICRVIVYLDTQCNGSSATTAEILASADLLAFENLQSGSRFKMLYDKVTTLNAWAGGGSTFLSRQVYDFMHFKKKVAIPVLFDNTAGAITVSNVKSNNIGILLISESANADFECNVRLRYVESC